MTKAAEFVRLVTAFERGKRGMCCHNAAHRVDSTKWHMDEVDEMYRFYYFSDGSKAGTILRRRPLQAWEA